MLRFAETCDAVASTSKKLEKIALVAGYFQRFSETTQLDHAAAAAVFLSGRPFAAYEQATLQVGGALLWRVIGELSGKNGQELTGIYRKHGDAGSVAADALTQTASRLSLTDLSLTGLSLTGLSLPDVQRTFFQIAAARGPASKAALLRRLLEGATPLEAKYIVKIISGDLRIGLKESLVEEAIARAFDAPLADVKRGNMLLGDIGATLQLAATQKLSQAKLRLFHPIDFMLASPVESSDEALSYFQNAAVEDKYDGIRAQAHVSHGEVRIFSRTRDEITESFPELPQSMAMLPTDAILDGEIVAWSSGEAVPSLALGRALPFSKLQQRLGRKKVSAKLMQEVPVAYLVFDVLYANGELLLDRRLQERAAILTQLLQPVGSVTGVPAVPAEPSQATPNRSPQTAFTFDHSSLPKAALLRAPVATANSPEDIEALFTAARARGNEGLMIKDLDSFYTPGRRGKSWLKMKRELATLDVVVTAVEYGHGKRIGVLSDYTFAVWNGPRLVNIGKAYSGLTDVEIAEMTKWFLEHKVSESGLRLEVEPTMVLEVAFNNMMLSSRHESGYALRFPRIVRLRPDKPAEDADTIDTVKQIYAREHSTPPA